MPQRHVNLPLLKDCVEMLGLALANHHHQWTDQQRRLWERAWAEIRYHQNKQGEDTSALRVEQVQNVRRQSI